MVFLKQKGGYVMFAMQLRPEVLEWLRKQYPVGTRAELIQMCDPCREMPPGLKGRACLTSSSGRWPITPTPARATGICSTR
jgi:hypothetical protein